MDILHKVGMKASVASVYKALSSAQGVAGWWTENSQGEGGVGSGLKFEFYADGKRMGGFDMKVLELDPDTRVLWEVLDGPADWIGTRISFDLKQEGEYAIVLFKHEGWRVASEHMAHCSTKWGVFMLSLKALIETGKGRPAPHDVKIDNWN